jgi:hypothetical protein
LSSVMMLETVPISRWNHTESSARELKGHRTTCVAQDSLVVPRPLPAWGSISGTMLRRLLAPANGPDRSLRAVGPYIEIGHQSAPDRQFPHAPFGSWFVSQIIPAAPNARRGPAPASQHTATHNHAPRGRVTGPQCTPNRQGASHYGHAFATLACGLDPVLQSGWSC